MYLQVLMSIADEELTKEIDSLLKLQQEGRNQNQETNTPQDTLIKKRRRLSEKATDTASTEFVDNVDHQQVLLLTCIAS